MKTCAISIAILVFSLALTCHSSGHEPAWRSLPHREPEGRMNRSIMCYVSDPDTSDWERPPFEYDHEVATLPREAKVIVINYNPILTSKGGTNLIQLLRANDPREYSDLLVEAIREASGGYINYTIVDFIEHDEFPVKIDGFRYTEESFLEARRTGQYHQPDKSDYRIIFENNNLIERCRDEGVTEIWLWGAGGFGYDELAMYIPNRYARFAPTLNPWFYRPYDIPEEVERTVWVMGFNYEVGADNMIHSYGHRAESILALVFGGGKWDAALGGQDPWNTFTQVPLDAPEPIAHCGNVHVPPNGVQGYDYNNPRTVLSYAHAWPDAYPDFSDIRPKAISADAWDNTQLGYQIWWLSRFPRGPGFTKWGYNNWWVYVANVDEDLPVWEPAVTPQEFIPPSH